MLLEIVRTGVCYDVDGGDDDNGGGGEEKEEENKNKKKKVKKKKAGTFDVIFFCTGGFSKSK